MENGQYRVVGCGDWLASVFLVSQQPRTLAAGLASSFPDSSKSRTFVAALATSFFDDANAKSTALPAVACSSLANFSFRKYIGRFVEVADSISANVRGQERRAPGSVVGKGTFPGVPCSDWFGEFFSFCGFLIDRTKMAPPIAAPIKPTGTLAVSKNVSIRSGSYRENQISPITTMRKLAEKAPPPRHPRHVSMLTIRFFILLQRQRSDNGAPRVVERGGVIAGVCTDLFGSVVFIIGSR